MAARKPFLRRQSPASFWGMAALSLAMLLTFTPCCKVFAFGFDSGASERAGIDASHMHDSGDTDDRRAPDPLCQPTWLDTAVDTQRDVGPARDNTTFPVLISVHTQPLLPPPTPNGNHLSAIPRSIGPPLYLRFGHLLN